VSVEELAIMPEPVRMTFFLMIGNDSWIFLTRVGKSDARSLGRFSKFIRRKEQFCFHVTVRVIQGSDMHIVSNAR
jgi:hypothetical protein